MCSKSEACVGERDFDIEKISYKYDVCQENFFFDIAEDPEENTPKEIFGEVSYKSFVESYKPDALIVGVCLSAI